MSLSFREQAAIAIRTSSLNPEDREVGKAVRIAQWLAEEACKQWGHDTYNEGKSCHRCGAKNLRG